MNKPKLFAVILGISNVTAGVILATFIILMQNPLALIMGVLYVIFGIGVIINKIYKKLLFWGIIPLTILHTFSIIMMMLSNDMPEGFEIPLSIGLLIILPLWIVIFGNVYSWKKFKKETL